jgi:predicted outer membrane repeat protein
VSPVPAPHRALAARRAGRRLAVRAGGGLLASLVLAACLFPGRAEARRLFVPQKHRTLQGAIDAASPGDTIWVKPGTYRGPIRITKRLVVFGEGGPDSTVLDGGDSVRVVHIEGANRGLLAGFTIRRGKAPGGGGVYCLRDTSLTVASCRFERNWEAGLAAWQCLGVAVTESQFLENEGSGLDVNASVALIRDCTFVGNSAPSGGGISLVNSEITGAVRKCRFEKNRATAGTGGAVFADSSTFMLALCLFAENSASVAGGAVSAMAASEGRVTVSMFRENRAASGGAIHADHSLVNITLSTFDRNHVNAAGAAIQMVGRGIANVNPLFTDNTFYKNSCSGEGAAVFCQSVSPEIRTSIFVVADSVRALTAFDSAPILDCNLIYDPSGLETGSLPSPTTLVGDPRFCDPEKGDFRVRDLSPAYQALCGPLGAFKKPCRSFEVLPDH